MRTLALAAMTMVTAFGASGADAQRIDGQQGSYPGASYPVPGNPGQGLPQAQMPMPPAPVMVQRGRPYPGQPAPNQPVRSQPRWGGAAGGRWYGAANAPGGLSAYHRPSRGYRLPNYWLGASFLLGDFAAYGLATPPYGYRWYRYYDDAVLVDDRGRVYDSVGGLDWDGGAYGNGGGYPQPMPPVTQNGAVTTYATSGGYAAGGYYYPPATTTIVTIQSAPTVTTTTTEYVEETTTRTRYIAPRRVVYRAAPKRVYHRVVRRTCSCTRAPVEQPVQGS